MNETEMGLGILCGMLVISTMVFGMLWFVESEKKDYCEDQYVKLLETAKSEMEKANKIIESQNQKLMECNEESGIEKISNIAKIFGIFI